MNADFDIIIAGGGMVGLTLALALDHAGFKCAVVDAAPEETRLAPEFDGRASAIAFASMRMLDVLGVGESLRQTAGPINEILVSDSAVSAGRDTHRPSPLTLHFDPSELAEDTPLGFMVENRQMRFALAEQARIRENLTLLNDVKVTAQRDLGALAEVDLSDGRSMTARLVIAADGKFSKLRDMAGIRTTGWDYPQSAIVTTVACEKPHDGLAHELFLPSGPFAILPLSDNRANIVWTEKRRAAEAAAKLPDALFAAELQRRFGDFLGKVAPVAPRWTYPLSLKIAENYTAPRLVLCGDAAHSIHPIAGQGFNMGLRDVAAMAEVLNDAKHVGLDIGAADTLEKFEDWRRSDNTLLAAATDMFVWLYSNNHASVRTVRDIGMAVVDKIPPARKFFMREAGGDVGHLPRLLRGEAL